MAGGGDWYVWHAPGGLRAIAATGLGCMQACIEKLALFFRLDSALVGPKSQHAND